ncbi:hypothetical protein BaRGS_00006427 [Batillaria attramentaria]|uniref:Reverse transcriptase zinc-binding domain-containing protein n=1 Tax=Batillaria attramentaria TaxID=370345 RepID=A0ABD0LSA8_9CAEN
MDLEIIPADTSSSHFTNVKHRHPTTPRTMRPDTGRRPTNLHSGPNSLKITGVVSFEINCNSQAVMMQARFVMKHLPDYARLQMRSTGAAVHLVIPYSCVPAVGREDFLCGWGTASLHLPLWAARVKSSFRLWSLHQTVYSYDRHRRGNEGCSRCKDELSGLDHFKQFCLLFPAHIGRL